MSVMKKATAVAAGTLFLLGAVATPSQAARPVSQDGLVNVNVGDVTIAEDVNVAAVVGVVAQLCGIDVGPASVAILGQAVAVDQSGRTSTVCQTDAGPVTITQN